MKGYHIDISTMIEYLEYAQELYNNAADVETLINAREIILRNNLYIHDAIAEDTDKLFNS